MNIAGYLTAVSGDNEITRGYASADGFHRNFYEDEYKIDLIEEGVRHARDTIDRLRKADAQIDEGRLPSYGATSPADYYERIEHESSNATLRTLREQGLDNRESGAASRVIRAAEVSKVDGLSFKIGADQRRATLGGDGRPKVGRRAPKPQRLTMDLLTAEVQQPGQNNRSKPYWPR